jgi:hypothetical protein
MSGSVSFIPFFQARSPISVTPTPHLEIAMKVSKALPVVLLLAAGWSCANAAADFIGIRRSQTDLTDVTPSMVVNFTLPTSLNRSTSTASSAVLDLEAKQVEFNLNEIYINPASTICSDDDNDGTNQPNSIGFLLEHDDINLKTEWATNHIAFSSALLKTGTNQLLICSRSETGDSSSGNNDDLSVRSIVLHYHTSP